MICSITSEDFKKKKKNPYPSPNKGNLSFTIFMQSNCWAMLSALGVVAVRGVLHLVVLS